MGNLQSWEDRRDMVTTNAWEAWTNNGNGMDDDTRHQTEKSVKDAVTNAWQDGMTDGDWYDATLAILMPARAEDLVLCRSDTGDGGWSLHAPGSTDEDIASGDAPYLVSGEAEEENGEWNRPNDADYRAALEQLRRQ